MARITISSLTGVNRHSAKRGKKTEDKKRDLIKRNCILMYG